MNLTWRFLNYTDNINKTVAQFKRYSKIDYRALQWTLAYIISTYKFDIKHLLPFQIKHYSNTCIRNEIDHEQNLQNYENMYTIYQKTLQDTKTYKEKDLMQQIKSIVILMSS